MALTKYILTCWRTWKICKPNTCVMHWMSIFWRPKLKLYVIKYFSSSKFMILFKLDPALQYSGSGGLWQKFSWNDQSLVWKNTKCISKVWWSSNWIIAQKYYFPSPLSSDPSPPIFPFTSSFSSLPSLFSSDLLSLFMFLILQVSHCSLSHFHFLVGESISHTFTF